MVMKKETIKKIAFSLAEAMISMLIISAIATMSIKLFAGQKTKRAADMAHHIMGCYILDNGGIAAMSMEIGKPETLQIEGFNAPNGNGFIIQNGQSRTSSQTSSGIPNIKLHYADWMFEGPDPKFPFGASAIKASGKHDGIKGPFCTIDVTETLGSTAKTLAMIGGGGFGFMSSGSANAHYNRPGDTGFFATYTNVDFSRPGVYRFYPGEGAKVDKSLSIDAQAVGNSSNRQGGSAQLVFVPTKRNSSGNIEEVRGSDNKNVEVLAEARGGYSRGHYYPLGPMRLSDIGCDDYQSCRFEATQFKIAKQTLTDVINTHCGGTSTQDCFDKVVADSANWATYVSPADFLGAASYKNYVTKVMPDASGKDQTLDYFAGMSGADKYNAFYMGGTMIATVAGNQITIGMNDLVPRCTNDMHNYLKLTANSGTPTIFTGKSDDPYLYLFGTGGACSNYHNLVPGNNAMPGKGGAMFLVW